MHLTKETPLFADIGATAIGAALIFAGFDQKASKIAFIPVALYILEIAWWARKDKFVLTHLTANLGVLVLFCELDCNRSPPLSSHPSFHQCWSNTVPFCASGS